MIEGLKGSPTDSGTIIFMCVKCKVRPENAFGARDKDQLVYVLICPNCSRILGEWASVEERDSELREVAKIISSTVD
jgi:hypothetical protein